MARIIEIDELITVGKLAELLVLPVSQLIGELFKNGIVATVNEKIDFDTAQIIVTELGLDVELAHKKQAALSPRVRPKLTGQDGEPRPPVVALMGHVDHGKTSLLDAIRGVSTTEEEAGGITQHLSAYQIKHNDRLLTLLDTPGHEAFAALREHGARLTDVAVIVIAADEGIKTQTLEAIRFARSAGVKIVVAASKIDKPNADLNRLKQQLAENELLPEDWGGETVIVPVSAKNKEGISELLDIVLLVADLEELKADSKVPAQGLIIEAHMEQGRGPIAKALVEQGTLRKGDFIVAGGTYGKIRNLETTTGQPVPEAKPATPVTVTGFKALPEFGDDFKVAESEKAARDEAAAVTQTRGFSGSASDMSSSELLRLMSRSDKVSELNMVIKADAQGSLTSVVDSLKALDTDEVAVRIVSSGIGVITENDIHLAATTNAIIYGFHIELPAPMKRLASRDQVPVRLFSIIYELIDDVKKELESLLAPEISEEVLGKLTVRGIFKITKSEAVIGGEVTDGKMATPALGRLYRGKQKLADDLELAGLKKGPTDVKEIQKGELCGLSFKTEAKLDVAEGDVVELFRREAKARTL